MDALTSSEIEWLQTLVTDFQDETDDLSQREWANAQVVLEKLEGMLDD